MANELRVLSGNCHCGGYRFELRGANLELVTTCSCRHCRKAGCLLLKSSPEVEFRIIRDDGKLVQYDAEGLKKEASHRR